MTTVLRSGFKDKIYQKNKIVSLLRFTESRTALMADPGFGSGPKSGSRAKLKGISPGGLRGSSPDPDPDCITTD
jgi:hypothetical protein